MKALPDWLLCLLAGALLLAGCSNADTLGGEAPDETLISGAPTWNNGVQEIMTSKCATCHVVPASDYTPAGTPSKLDLSVYAGDNVTRFGANTLGAWISGGILERDMGSIRKMPLAYATPLTSGEISALETWATNGTPEN